MSAVVVVEVVCRAVAGAAAPIDPDRSVLNRCMSGVNLRRWRGLRLRLPCWRIEHVDVQLRPLDRELPAGDSGLDSGGIRLRRHRSPFSGGCGRAGRRVGDYDPTTGTFLTRDPLGDADGTTTVANPYAYGLNDPLNRVDPLGLRSTDCTMNGPKCTKIVTDLPGGGVSYNGGAVGFETMNQHRSNFESAMMDAGYGGELSNARVYATMSVADYIAGYSTSIGVNPFLAFAVGMNDIGGSHYFKEKIGGVPVIGDWEIPQCMEDTYNAHTGGGTLGITNISLGAFRDAADMYPALLEISGSIEDNWRSLACNPRYAVKAMAYYLKYIQARFWGEIVSQRGAYEFVTRDEAYASGWGRGADGYERDMSGERLLSQSALYSTGYTEGPGVMVDVMQGTVDAGPAGFGWPGGGGGAFNTVDLMPIAKLYYCGTGAAYYSC